MTAFSAKDSTTGLDIDPGRDALYYQNLTTVDGRAYYKNTMGRAIPAAPQSKVGTFRPSAGAFYLDYNGNGAWDGCGTDRCLSMGLNGDTPLVGQW